MVLRAKICILGEQGVGKTSLILKYVKDYFPIEYKASLGADFLQKTITSDEVPELEGKNMELIIWDIAGQKSYELNKMTDYYLQGSNGFILVYDRTNKKSLKDLDSWYKKISKICGDIPFIIVGNKSDLADQIEATEKDLRSYQRKWKAPSFYSSAKTGKNVDKIFHQLVRLIL